VTNTSDSTIWVDDAIPSGAIAGQRSAATPGTGSGTARKPYSGQLAQRTANAAGLHEHFFYSAGSPLKVKQGDGLFAYVYLDPNYCSGAGDVAVE
jgi:hypothetical protein